MLSRREVILPVFVKVKQCARCGIGYLTTGATEPHDEAECIAFRRGYQDGLIAATPGYDRGLRQGIAAAKRFAEARAEKNAGAPAGRAPHAPPDP